MTFPAKTSLLSILFPGGALFLVSCGEPEETASGPDPESERAPAGSVVYLDEIGGDETPSGPDILIEGERKEPELRVFWEDGVIVVEGAFSSRIQQERIGRELSEAFTGTRVDNRIELDYQRYPVGWGNRVTEMFLIPYFREIENASVSYREGIVTIEGKGDPRSKRYFQESVVETFSGTFSRGIENRIAFE